jgi:hypothetical protein
MTNATFATPASSRLPAAGGPGAGYRPGVCNIGPEEMARRRRAGHLGAAVSIATLAVLIVAGAPPISRLLVALPVAGAASGYLQAWLHFCAGFGSRGVFNFGALGRTSAVADAESRARDRARSMQIGLASVAVGVVAGVMAVAVPAIGI